MIGQSHGPNAPHLAVAIPERTCSRCFCWARSGKLLQYVDAVRLDGQAGDGRTQPLRASVETADGHSVDVYLKALHDPNLIIEGLMNEALAATVAAELGLPMPQAFLVRIDAPFINSVRSEALRERLTRTPIAFALQDLGANWRKWNSTDRLMPARAFLALQVFAFDAFIGNNDRSPIRPNLMTSPQAGEIALIDHESAFWLRVHFAHRVEPWKLGNLNPLSIRGAESEHLFFRSLHRTSPLDVGSVGKTWERLTDDRLAAYSAALPPEWASAGTGLNDALHHLGTVRDRMAECLKELVRVLS